MAAAPPAGRALGRQEVVASASACRERIFERFVPLEPGLSGGRERREWRFAGRAVERFELVAPTDRYPRSPRSRGHQHDRPVVLVSDGVRRPWLLGRRRV